MYTLVNKPTYDTFRCNFNTVNTFYYIFASGMVTSNGILIA